MPRLLFLALLLLTALRFALIMGHELQEDESYYFQWAQHLAPSYYSKGPGIASVIWLGTWLFGATEFGVRFFSPLLALGTSVLLFRLARSLFDEVTAGWTVVLLNVTPIFTAGAVLMTIDPLSVFFWVATMLAFWRALHRASPLSVYWLLAGLGLGLGFLCKYTNAFQILSILAILLCTRRWRAHFRKPGLYFMLFVFLLCTLPVLWWNAQHGWITLTHLKERGSLDEARGLRLTELLSYLGLHLAVYSPLVFIALAGAIGLALRSARQNAACVFVLAFALPIIATYFALSLRDCGEPNWTAPGFVSAAMLVPWAWAQRPGRWFSGRAWRFAMLGLAMLLSALLLQTDLLRAAGLQWSYFADPDRKPEPAADALARYAKDPSLVLENQGDPSRRMRGWRESAAALGLIAREYTAQQGQVPFLIANRWQSASALAFYLPKDLPVLRPDATFPLVHPIQDTKIQHQYSFWPRYDQVSRPPWPGSSEAGAAAPEYSHFAGKNALYCTDMPERINAPRDLERCFKKVSVLTVVDIMRRDQVVRRWKVWLCEEYQPGSG